MENIKKVVICADDFGMTLGINKAITDLFLNQRITVTTIMPSAHYFDDAVELVKQHEIPCGVHLTIATELDKNPLKPLLSNTPTDKNGFLFPNVFPYLQDIDAQLVYEEFRAQILKVINAGIQPTHIDSHMHVYSRDVLKKLSLEFSLPCRDFLETEPKYAGTLFHLTTSGETAEEKVKALIAFLNNSEKEQCVVVTHPTRDLSEMKTLVSQKFSGRYDWQTRIRFEDFPCLASEECANALQKKDIKLSHELSVEI